MFKEQVTLGAQFETAFYLVTLVASVLAVAGIFLIDAGLSRRGNVLHTMVQKLAATFSAAIGMSLIGYGIWNWQYYKAFGIENPLGESIKAWWIGGSNLTTLPQHLDPAVTPTADAFQFFFVIFVVFASFFSSLLAGAVIERVKTVPLSVIAFVFGALAIPFLAYLVYGSTGPLSNYGTHEYAGCFFYILLGCWALVLVWRAKPRPGVFRDSKAGPPVPHNLVLTGVGAVIVITALCGYVLGNGFLIPGEGYFGIALNESGMGLVVTNTFMGMCSGGLGGLVAWKLGKHIYFFLIAPLAGWVAISAMADVATPWAAALIAFPAPLILLAGHRLLHKLKLDDPKVVPLTLGPGIYGALMVAAVATNQRQGGYFGLGGDYELQHARITLGHQLIGVGVTLAFGLVSALVVIMAVEKTIGLRDKRIDEGMSDNLDIAVIGESAYPLERPGFNGDHDVAEPYTGVRAD